MADTPIANPFDGLQGIFDKIIGSKTVGTDQQSLTTEQILNNLLSTISNQQQNTTGTTGQTTNQQTSNVISNNADIGALQKVFQQQQAGVTPDMLKAIFSEGAKAVPQLVATTANAVGARPGTNSSLATSLDSLNSNLVNQAAVLNQGMLKDSASTAAQIAELTKQQTNTGTTAGTNQITTQQLLQNLLNQTQQQNQTQNTAQQKRVDTTNTTGINTKQTGVAAGLAGLAALLGSDTGKAAIGAGGDAINKLLGGYFGSSGGSSGDTGSTTGIFNPFDPTIGTPDVSLPPGVGDYGSNPYIPVTTTPTPDTGSIDWSGFGFADGGIVQPKLLQITDTKNGAPNVAQLLALLGTGGGLSSNGSSTGGTSGPGATAGVDPATLLNSGGGEGAASAGDAGNSSVASSTNTSVTGINPSSVIGMIGSLATGNMLGALLGAMNMASNASISTTVGPADLGMAPDAAAIGIADSSPDANGTVGDVGADASADAGDSGDGGDGGDGDGGDGGGGWANGGVIPKRKVDPKGVMDPLRIAVSGGEAIIPTDVVDMMGPDFFNNMIALYHTPAVVQKTHLTQLVDD